jgi:hypothetical protein
MFASIEAKAIGAFAAVIFLIAVFWSGHHRGFDTGYANASALYQPQIANLQLGIAKQNAGLDALKLAQAEADSRAAAALSEAKTNGDKLAALEARQRAFKAPLPQTALNDCRNAQARVEYLLSLEPK